MQPDPPLTLTDIRLLAPADLRPLRSSRYLGEDICITLDRLAPKDRQAAADLYALLRRLHAAVTPMLSDRDASVAELVRFVRSMGWFDQMQRLRDFGRPSREIAADEIVQKVVHDLRGGAIQALSLHFQFLELGMATDESVTRIFLLARDQLKIMRNAVMDLDPAGAARDREERLHNIQLLTEKWHDALHGARGRRARVYADVRYDGSISERCVEFAALDRVLYNLINNATQHAADEQVFLTVLPIPESRPVSLRFVVANAVSGEQRAVLNERFGDDLSRLFSGGFTTGGTGLGMRICADFVSNAYGLRSLDDAIHGRYIGARLVGETYVAWFHWPIVAD